MILPIGGGESEALSGQISKLITDAGLRPLLASEQNVITSSEHRRTLERLEEEAEQLELSLDLEQASARRREIVEVLERLGATAAHPERLANALSRLSAIELEAEHPDEALRLFRRALALRSDLRLDSTFSPRARAVFEHARSAGGTLPPRPGPEALDQLCQDLSVAAVLWIALGYDEDELTFVQVFYRAGQESLAEVRHGLGELEATSAPRLPEVFVEHLDRELASLAPSSTDPPRVPPVVPPRHWYRSWWFWTTVGVIVAGAATATGLALGLGEEQVDVEVHLP